MTLRPVWDMAILRFKGRRGEKNVWQEEADKDNEDMWDRADASAARPAAGKRSIKACNCKEQFERPRNTGAHAMH
jgi:hypothetical protein